MFTALLLGLFSCGSDTPADQTKTESPPSKSEELINQAIEAHGGELYETAHYQFTFRDKVFTFKNNGQEYVYTSEHQTDQGWQKDYFENGEFERKVGGTPINLSTEAMDSYGETLNSVIYFATLPHKLSDASVNSKHKGQTTINEINYEQVLVTFSQEGGGEDFDDEYVYWINSETNKVDYFAYNYQVNGGGVRFRAAFNSRKVDGIVFQDYINYSAAVGTPLLELAKLYEEDKLVEVSRIELVDVKVIK